MTTGPSDGPEPPEDRPGAGLRPTSPAALTVCGVLGLLGGWSIRRIASYVDATAPLISWAQALVLLFVALILAATARATARAVARPVLRPEAHRLVNRLVLARACALVGALAAGGYVGYAVSWLGASAELADQRAVRAAVAGVGGLAVMITALLLERACRVPPDVEEP